MSVRGGIHRRNAGDYLDLIQEVVKNRRPELLALVSRIGRRKLDTAERELLRECLAHELTESGLRPDYEPNERGLYIEAAIDWLGHQ